MAHKTSFITESFRDYINGLIAMNICQFYTEYCLFAWYRKLGFSLRVTSATCSAINTISGWAQYLAHLLLILSFMRREFWSTVEQSSPSEITAVFSLECPRDLARWARIYRTKRQSTMDTFPVMTAGWRGKYMGTRICLNFLRENWNWVTRT